MSSVKNILIVDDDMPLQAALKHALQKEKYKVRTASSLEICKERLISAIPDMILLDVVLPDGNGIDFVKELSENSLYSSIGILLMSGLKTDQPFVQQGLDNGALYFTRKPFDIKTLLQQIALIFKVRELEKKRLKQEERFTHLFSNVNDILFTINSKNQILDISKSFGDITGLSVSDILKKNFSELLADESKDIWLKKLKAISEGNVLPSFELFLINTFNNLIPIDIQLTSSKDDNTSETVIIGIAKDLRPLKQLEAEMPENDNPAENREFSAWESMENPNTRQTELSYEVSALNDERSEIFFNMLNAYHDLVDVAIQQRIYKIDTDNSLKQRMFAKELGFLKAGPKDLIKIHTTFYRTLSGKINQKKIVMYHEEARLILLSVMGYLVSFYRNRNIKTYE